MASLKESRFERQTDRLRIVVTAGEVNLMESGIGWTASRVAPLAVAKSLVELELSDNDKKKFPLLQQLGLLLLRLFILPLLRGLEALNDCSS